MAFIFPISGAVCIHGARVAGGLGDDDDPGTCHLGGLAANILTQLLPGNHHVNNDVHVLQFSPSESQFRRSK